MHCWISRAKGTRDVGQNSIIRIVLGPSYYDTVPLFWPKPLCLRPNTCYQLSIRYAGRDTQSCIYHSHIIYKNYKLTLADEVYALGVPCHDKTPYIQKTFLFLRNGDLKEEKIVLGLYIRCFPFSVS